MKKSKLSFGGIMMLLLLVFSCTEGPENIKLPDESVNLKGEVDKEKQEVDERKTYNVTHLITYLHGYIKQNVSKDFKHYENIPERKDVNWFIENFRNTLNSESEGDKWVLDKIKSQEIQIFGTTVKGVNVTALIFQDGLDIHPLFAGKRGIFFDGDDPDEPCWEYKSIGREGFALSCFCHAFRNCDDMFLDGCDFCWDEAKDFDFDDYFDFDLINDIDPRVVNPIRFEIIGSRPVSDISIGEPILQF